MSAVTCTCTHCGHTGEPILATQSVPLHYVELDPEDPQASEHELGIDVDGELTVGLEVCRQCHTLLSHWIEGASAPFRPDWGSYDSRTN